MFCPAISTPESFNFSENILSNPNIRKTLIHITKILQNCSNQKKFEKEGLEELNNWIDQNQQKMNDYLLLLSGEGNFSH